jgi:hypothetical protein
VKERLEDVIISIKNHGLPVSNTIYPALGSIFTTRGGGSYEYKDKLYGMIYISNGTLDSASKFYVPFGEEYYYEKYGKVLLTDDFDFELNRYLTYSDIPKLEKLLIELNNKY